MVYNDVGTTVILSTLLFLLLIAGFIITMFLSKRRNARQEMRIAQMQLDYEKELRKVHFEVQEQILANISRDLHDNIGHKLTFINLQLQQHKFLSKPPGTLLDSIGANMIEAVDELRRLSRSFNGDIFEKQGLAQVLQQEVQRLIQLNKYEVSWISDSEPLLDKDQKVIAFRIFQEIMNNIMKHAGAGKIDIAMTGAGRFHMVVSDNGQGFDYENMLRSGKGSGLKNIVKRAEMAKLKCTINSIIGKGSTFTLETI